MCDNCKRRGFECKQAEFIINTSWLATPDDTPPAHAIDKSSSSPDAGPSEVSLTCTWDVFNHSRSGLQNYCLSNKVEANRNSSSDTTYLDVESVHLLRIYQNGIATWMDLFDHSLSYRREVLSRALTSPLILHSICALGARQLALVEKSSTWMNISSNRYGKALRLLIDACVDENAKREELLTATILLSSVELLTAPGGDYKKHLFGATTLIKSAKVNASSTGLFRAAFWIYARQDVAMALVNECPTYLSPDEWDVSWSEMGDEEDILASHMLWLLNRTINFVFASPGLPSERREFDSWSKLMAEIDRWYELLPAACKGVPYGQSTREGFRQIWFAVPAAPAALATYHEAKLLLLAEDSPFTTPPRENIHDQIQYHASQIVSIAMSDLPDGALVQTVQPLYFGKYSDIHQEQLRTANSKPAGKHIDGLSRKARIWSILNEIEAKVGFHTSSRVAKLQNLLENQNMA